MTRGSTVSRVRRRQISHEARQIHSRGLTRGLTVDQIQDELLRTFPGELAVGEARMLAEGWNLLTVHEGLLALAAEDGRGDAGLEPTDVRRWLRGEVRPTIWMERLCKLFRCHQARLGWPPQGNEVAVDFTPQGGSPEGRRDSEALGTGYAEGTPAAASAQVPSLLVEDDDTRRRIFLSAMAGSALFLATKANPVVRALHAVYQLEGRVGGETVDGLEEAVAGLGNDYLRVRPEQQMPCLVDLLAYTEDLLWSQDVAAYRSRVLDVAGWLSCLLANAYFDVNDLTAARARARAALAYGQQAGDMRLSAWACDMRSKIAFYTDDFVAALRYAQEACALAPRRTSMAARTLAQQARVHARLGDGDRTITTLRSAETEYDRLPASEMSTSPLYGVGQQACLQCWVSGATVWLDEPRFARLTRENAQQIIDCYSRLDPASSRPTRLSLARLDLAVSLTRCGEPADACHFANAALSTSRMVGAVLQRASALDAMLIGRWPDVSEVRDLNEKFMALSR